jgi:hypothetical protein
MRRHRSPIDRGPTHRADVRFGLADMCAQKAMSVCLNSDREGKRFRLSRKRTCVRNEATVRPQPNYRASVVDNDQAQEDRS